MSQKIAERLKQLCFSLDSYGETEAAKLIKESFDKLFKNLRRGDKGPGVRKMQSILVGRGFQLPQHGVDGVFGPETEAAVKEFQETNQLKVDGVVGPQTISKLDPAATIQTSVEETQIAPEEQPKVSFSMKRFKPFSRRARRLFRGAAAIAGVPEAWANSESLHSILKKESEGWVGIPNYTYGKRQADPSYWGQIHEELRNGVKATRSSATGLGQLLLRNVDKYYPSGRNGIGDPTEEAVGMLLYIKDRYSSPEEAWSMYGSAEKTDPDTGTVFTEGY
jgi:hypothetical protein